MSKVEYAHKRDPAGGGASFLARWELRAGAGDADWVSIPVGVLSVQVWGTFGGAKVTLEGTNANDGPGMQLNQQFSDDLAFEAPGFAGIRDIPRLLRPALVGGDKSTLVYVALYGVSR